MDYMVFREQDVLTGNIRCVIRNRKGRKFGDFGSWDAATQQATKLNRIASGEDFVDEEGNYWGHCFNNEGRRVRVCIPSR